MVLLGWFLWPFLQTARGQVSRAHAKLITAAAKRNWPEVKEYLAASFRTVWDLNRDDAMAEAAEHFQGFLYLNITWTTDEITVNGDMAKIRGTMRMNGSGAGLSQYIIDKVNALREPWVFTWHKEGWKPSSWRLESVQQHEIEERNPGDGS